MIVFKKLNPDQVADVLRAFVLEFQQPELRYVIAFAIGYYGAIDDTVWEAIRQLIAGGDVVV